LLRARIETRGETRNARKKLGFRNIKEKNLARPRRTGDNVRYSNDSGRNKF
jgi:hypothetical protein